jgi:hypothetical protein
MNRNQYLVILAGIAGCLYLVFRPIPTSYGWDVDKTHGAQLAIAAVAVVTAFFLRKPGVSP